MGAYQVVDSTDSEAIWDLAGRFDFLIATVNLNIDQTAFAFALTPRGRLVMVGAILEQLNTTNLALIMGQRAVAGSAVGSPGTITKMLDFAARQGIKPIVETYPLGQVNDTVAKLRSSLQNLAGTVNTRLGLRQTH